MHTIPFNEESLKQLSHDELVQLILNLNNELKNTMSYRVSVTYPNGAHILVDIVGKNKIDAFTGFVQNARDEWDVKTSVYQEFINQKFLSLFCVDVVEANIEGYSIKIEPSPGAFTVITMKASPYNEK